MNLKNIHKAIEKLAAAYVASHNPSDPLVQARAAEAVAYLKGRDAAYWKTATVTNAYQTAVANLELGRWDRPDLADPAKLAAAQKRGAKAKEKRDRQVEAKRRRDLASLPDLNDAMIRAEAHLRRIAKGDTGVGWEIRQLVDAAEHAKDGRVSKFEQALRDAGQALLAQADRLKERDPYAVRPERGGQGV